MPDLRKSLVIFACLLLAGCSATYYLQAATGQAELMRTRRPMEQVLRDPSTPAAVREKLLVVDSALVFARVRLGLPSAGSYRDYADLGRPYVVWNVFAAPEFSLTPRQWCYPFAGCAPYRGWFSEEQARRFADGLAAEGADVFVGGVPAYSTLGWFDDPVLNTMLARNDAELAGLLFHELAHQRLYVRDDTLFNEGFAAFVEEEGTRRWLIARGELAAACAFDVYLQRRAGVMAIFATLREELAGVYSSGQPPEVMRRERAAVVAAARLRYTVRRNGWTTPPNFDRWFDGELNNARLAALATYADYVPAFQELLRAEGGDLEGFYARAAQLGALRPGARDDAIAALLAASEATGQAAVSAGQSGGTCPSS